ncbi:MAG: OmpA family protein [Crocinitomicaceae bacterium]
MKLVLIIIIYFFSLELAAQDSLKFEYDDSIFVVGEEKTIELRREICNTFGLKNEGLIAIDSLYQFLKKNEGISILVTEHTDTRGSTAANQKLSEARAKAIKSELVSRGIAEGRIEAIGKGESEPIHSEVKINQYKQTDPFKFQQLLQINRRTVVRIDSI